MSMIKVENLTFAYPSSFDNIFENVNFQIDTDWRLGFVGRNGRGKTTFLNLLLGKYEYSGKIHASVQFDYFPYPVGDKSRMTLELLHEICPGADDWEFIRELSYLQTDAEVLYRPFCTLSNGEQTKTLLCALFLNEGHFLLIDEPTNHLDMHARAAVCDYLRRKKGFILVSHDRSFLDGCVDHILSLNRSDIDVQSGNFSSWFAGFQRRQDFENAQNEHLKKDIARLQKAAARTSAWSDKTERSKFGNSVPDRGFVGHKSAKMMKRSKTIEARQRQAIEQKSSLLKNAEKAESLKIHAIPYHSDTLLTLSDVQACYGGKTVCPPVSLTLRRGERIAIDGKNGSGKSSLLKLITGEHSEYTGTLSVGAGLKISYVSQETSRLCGNISDFAAKNCIDESLFKTILRKLDFDRVQFEKDIKDFSGGQKKKVLIAKSLCEQAHLYVWDEPLNFIDIYSRMQLEQVINDYEPTMVFVEHDKCFRDAVATKVVQI